jgi:septum site-determining protein MinC
MEANMDKAAVFKGSKEGIVLLVNPDLDFTSIINFLSKTLEERKLFFSGASLLLDTNDRIFSEEELKNLGSLFQKYGVSFRIKGEEKIYGTEFLNLSNLQEEKMAVVTHTMRSGQSIKFDGSVVVLGDINEGAEVNASKNVYVFGIVRGIINAGEKIISLGFQPIRMSIGRKMLEVAPSDKSYRKPRVAELENGEIVFKVIGEKKSLRRKE